jgi:uncharacterized membrane protein (UPF0127 family)
MHRRFADAPTVELECAGGSVRAAVAERFRLRLLGLMRLDAEELEPLLFPRCRSIHMHGMRTTIDLVWLALEGDKGKVLDVVGGLPPGGHSRAPRNGSPRESSAALELAPGDARRLGLSPGATLRVLRPRECRVNSAMRD